MLDVTVKVKRLKEVELPKYATIHSSGVDLASTEEYLLKSGETTLISTGLSVEIPLGFELQIRPRSGLSVKGLRVANSPGTIDGDYRGEIFVIMHNASEQEYFVRNGERVAQAVLCPVFKISWEEQEELSETERGDGGFGSTGHI